MRFAFALLIACLLPGFSFADDLADRAHAILKANCYRCHGRDGALEGGMNYVLDREKLVARKKIVPGQAEQSPLFQRVAAGKMPPPGEEPRPSEADVAVLKEWIDTGAVNPLPVGAARQIVTEADVFARILADLETLDKRSRKFARYFTLTHLANAGLSEDELQTYRNALAKLVNSLSWHPRITVPKAIDSSRTILRIDLRDLQWDANLWNRILADYPYGILDESALARACSVTAATRMPFVRADWFVATASRAPLYHDILQVPTSLVELERQLRVDAAVNIQQERVARAGFNGSGIAKNNRLLERHDAVHGAYWRSYDFDAVPQNLVERDNLLPDRRNLFAHPLGPGFTEASFQHAGGEAIYNLPNGLQAYFIVNAVGQRLDKAPTAIVADPKRPDKAVEVGVSCMGCHYAGINPKSDQVREYVLKNPKAFSKTDAELILSLYPPEAKMKAMMEEDAARFRAAVEKTGVKVSAFEPILAMTLRYEADVDLTTAAAETDLQPDDFIRKLSGSSLLSRNLGALKVAGGTVQRQVWLQAFGDVVRELQLGVLLQATLSGQSLPDNTGEIDPLEGQSGQANAMAFSSDGRWALFASADKSVRLWDVDRGRELRRFIGHTASVWSVAFAPDGKRALSGSADNTVRLWDVELGRELARLQGHSGVVTCVAFASDGKKALSASYDHTLCLWDLEAGKLIRSYDNVGRYIHAVAFAPDGKTAAVAAEKTIRLLDLDVGEEVGRCEGHGATVVALAVSGDRLVSCGDDGTARLWDLETRKQERAFSGHIGYVKCLALSVDGKRLLTGGADHTVRLWDVESGAELRRLTQHAATVIAVSFNAEGKESLSGSRDSAVRIWNLK